MLQVNPGTQEDINKKIIMLFTSLTDLFKNCNVFELLSEPFTSELKNYKILGNLKDTEVRKEKIIESNSILEIFCKTVF